MIVARHPESAATLRSNRGSGQASSLGVPLQATRVATATAADNTHDVRSNRIRTSQNLSTNDYGASGDVSRVIFHSPLPCSVRTYRGCRAPLWPGVTGSSSAGHSHAGTRRVDAGITYINAPTIGAEAHLPFGGVKETGNGHREGGWQVYDFFSETKTVYVDYSGRLQRAQIDTYEA